MSVCDIRPKRTIVFCTWGGEEVGLLGSTEWVEVSYHQLFDYVFVVRYIHVRLMKRGKSVL
ncbi:hypothetical protein CHS0354_022973 [Potamilus streckersoni]|uniref:Peptidase M28 domain-containing protein n=1 Tax=Potamilus streckersoni TaxID=2493646 RepID=A0AAE0S5T9_9BIVA|nr:hypothetical protein CHS0354_022973 [Potamilus streckersoni]